MTLEKCLKLIHADNFLPYTKMMCLKTNECSDNKYRISSQMDSKTEKMRTHFRWDQARTFGENRKKHHNIEPRSPEIGLKRN